MWIFLIFISAFTWAFPTLHLIKPESNFTQITTLDACTTYLSGPDMVGCNPALFPLQRQEGFRMGLSTITDGESVEVGQKLLFDPIKKEFLQKLFNQRSYNSWDFNSSIELRTSKFYLAYDPLSVNADVFVFNPASPEIAMSLVKSNRLQITSGVELLNSDSLLLTMGSKIYYYRSQYYQDSFFLSDLSGNDVKDLIKLRKRSGVAGDVGAFLQIKNSWFPKFSLLLKNIGSNFRNTEKDIIAENQMRPLLTYETYSRLGLGYDYKTTFGSFSSELNLAFRGFFEDYYSEYPSLSLGYALTRFNTQISYSKYQQVLGFNFGSKIASIGIFYGNTRPLGDFSTQTDNVGGIRMELSL
jgi:hypothetical protein